MDLWWWFGGWIRGRLSSGDCLRRLQVISREVRLEDVSFSSEVTVEFSLRRRDLKKLSTRDGETFEILRQYGLPNMAKSMARWKSITSVVLLFAVLTAWLPSRVLFLQVEGNGDIPARRILEAARGAGLFFGAERREVRSEAVKNHLLHAIGELRWAGVNTQGCTATITVSPRSMEGDTARFLPGDLVAVRDALVTDIYPEAGTVQVQRGQAVGRGAVLICGTADLGILMRQDRASGEVYGLTRQEITAIVPGKVTVRQGTGRVERTYSLRIGKKSLKFTNDSGILDTTCVKMVTVNYLTLPGGFRLPVALVTETRTRYATAAKVREEADHQLLSEARSYALAQMRAGTILAEDWDGKENTLTARFECREMIARFRPAENLEGETNDDREIGERGAG